MKELIFLQAVDIEQKMSELDKLWDKFWPAAQSFLIKLAVSIIVFIISKKLLKLFLNLTRKGLERAKFDLGVAHFITSVLQVLAYILIITMIADILGLPTTSFVAILGSAGLAIGLALQGSLSNFAGGVLLLVLKPFRVGDYIIVGVLEGTVTAVDIFYTKIITSDNRLVVLPNGSLSNSNITNVTNEPNRRLDLIIPIGYDDDIRTVKDELNNIILRHELILKEKNMDIFVNAFGDDAVEIAIRVWVAKENYLTVKSELLETIKYMFDEKGFSIPYRKMDIVITNNKES
ncbi:mechanosensitive ion channel family protein [Clostridium sp. Marseille-P299]|uniref:mechanosensitive ion channel family protein n=1 Tax=Clostridium sp. Marseille-P299 TaxID=1805477 RepID=UPI00082B31E8|nr:mechanosensitive ion channel domain-containing protein [Clostridium sp. Marseille-P299]